LQQFAAPMPYTNFPPLGRVQIVKSAQEYSFAPYKKYATLQKFVDLCGHIDRSALNPTLHIKFPRIFSPLLCHCRTLVRFAYAAHIYNIIIWTYRLVLLHIITKFNITVQPIIIRHTNCAAHSTFPS